MNVVVKTVVVSFNLNNNDCKILLDVYNNLPTIVIDTSHKSVEEACRQSIEEILKTDAGWMPVRFLFFGKDGDELQIYYGVLVPEEIVIIKDGMLWTGMQSIINNKKEIDKDVQKAIWEAIRRVK